jgi:hypothetical protein
MAGRGHIPHHFYTPAIPFFPVRIKMVRDVTDSAATGQSPAHFNATQRGYGQLVVFHRSVA